MDSFDVIIIGQGYAGLTAAQAAVQRGLRTANLESQYAGGLITNINELDPVPHSSEHSGAELAGSLAMKNMDLGVVAISEAATAVETGGVNSWVVKTDFNAYRARHVVVASGARLRKLGIAGEQEFFGQGVSECAGCDGPMFKDMETVVIGGGDSAFQESLALAQFARKVTIMMRGAAPRARTDLLERAAANSKLAQFPNTRITAVLGTPGSGVEAVRVETAGAGERTVACAGVFVFIGLEPNTAFLPTDVRRDSAGALVTSDQCATALRGLWAIGAVRSGFGGTLTDAAEDANRAIAALS